MLKRKKKRGKESVYQGGEEVINKPIAIRIVNENNNKDKDILNMYYSKKEKIVNIVLSIFESIPTILTHPIHLPHNTFAFDINPTRIATKNK